jgi:hypothetical protein
MEIVGRAEKTVGGLKRTDLKWTLEANLIDFSRAGKSELIKIADLFFLLRSEQWFRVNETRTRKIIQWVRITNPIFAFRKESIGSVLNSYFLRMIK